jgi:murein L,D-transpeptidase YafK
MTLASSDLSTSRAARRTLQYTCRVRVIVVILLVSCASLHASPLKCPNDVAAIVVDTESHRMGLCEAGLPVRELPVAIGGGGVDKQREGDRKTPLGSYPLAAPRDSSKFHRFIEVGYPTREQRAEGRTGGDVGIHGPSRKHPWLGKVRNWFDWTDGCIAVASDEAIDQVVSWMTQKHPSRVVIR